MKELTMNEMEQVNGGLPFLLIGIGLRVVARYTGSAGIRYACSSIGLGVSTSGGARHAGRWGSKKGK